MARTTSSGPNAPSLRMSSPWKTTWSSRSPSSSRSDVAVAAIDGVDDLASLFEHVAAQALAGLLAVPGAAVGGQETLHDLDEADVRCPLLLGERGDGDRCKRQRHLRAFSTHRPAPPHNSAAHEPCYALRAVSAASLSPSPTSPRRLILVAALCGALLLTYLLRGVLVPLFFAFLLAYALDPFVDRLEAVKVPRAVGAILVMGLICGAAITVLILAVPYLVDEFRLAGEQLPEQLRALKERVEPLAWQLFHINLPHTWGELIAKIGDELRARTPDLIQGRRSRSSAR